jgi:ribonuclease HII
MRIAPSFDREAALLAAGCGRVAGVDEVGRGPLAGPVMAAAVILDPRRIPESIDDSKRLSAPRRERLARAIEASAVVAFGEASVQEVDRLNVRQATLLAMRRAVAALPVPPGHVLVDGRDLPELGLPATALVGGDRLSLSVAAASVVAKVRRDRVMTEAAQHWPGFGWERNAGLRHEKPHGRATGAGADPFHRRSFSPVSQMLWQGQSSGPREK